MLTRAPPHPEQNEASSSWAPSSQRWMDLGVGGTPEAGRAAQCTQKGGHGCFRGNSCSPEARLLGGLRGGTAAGWGAVGIWDRTAPPRWHRPHMPARVQPGKTEEMKSIPTQRETLVDLNSPNF